MNDSLDEQLLAELEGIFEAVTWHMDLDGIVGVLPWNESLEGLLADLEWYGFQAGRYGGDAVKVLGWLE